MSLGTGSYHPDQKLCCSPVSQGTGSYQPDQICVVPLSHRERVPTTLTKSCVIPVSQGTGSYQPDPDQICVVPLSHVFH